MPAILSDENVQAIKTAHSGTELFTFDWQGGTVLVFKLPSRVVYKLFRKNCDGVTADQRYDAEQALCVACVVSDAGAFAALVESYPGIAETLAARIVQNAGYDQQANAKKL